LRFFEADLACWDLGSQVPLPNFSHSLSTIEATAHSQRNNGILLIALRVDLLPRLLVMESVGTYFSTTPRRIELHHGHLVILIVLVVEGATHDLLELIELGEVRLSTTHDESRVCRDGPLACHHPVQVLPCVPRMALLRIDNFICTYFRLLQGHVPIVALVLLS